MKNKKKFFAAATALAMMLAGVFNLNTLPAKVFATPLLISISDCAGLQAISNNPGAFYGLSQDIDCSATSTWNPDGLGGFMGFDPIDNFTGVLNGNGHTIDHLYINRPNETEVALFKQTFPLASISNLTLTHIDITGGDYTGGLIGHAKDAFMVSFVNVSGTLHSTNGIGGVVAYIEATVSGTSTIDHTTANITINNASGGGYVGGLVGLDFIYDPGTNVNITNSRATVAITGSDMEDMGGLIGKADVENAAGLTVQNCSSTGTINNQGQSTGGLIGLFHSEGSGIPFLTLTGSHSDASIFSTNWDTGGLVGQIESASANMDVEMSRNYFDGSLDGGGFGTGGLIGRITAADLSSGGSVLVDDSYNSGSIGGNDDVGGLIGDAISPVTLSLHDAYSTGDIFGNGNVAGIMGAGYGTIDKVYASGTIDMSNFGLGNLAGLIGFLKGGQLSNSFSVAAISDAPGGSLSNVAGLVGVYKTPDATLTNNFYDQVATGHVGVIECSYASDAGFNESANSTVGQCEAKDTSTNSNNPGYAPNYFVGQGGGGAHAPLNSWDFSNVWQVNLSGYPTQDLFTQTPTLTLPASNSETINTSPLQISFTIPEAIDTGSLSLTFTPYSNHPGSLDYAGSPIVIALNSVTPNVVNTLSLPTTGGISGLNQVISTSSDTIPPGTYRVTLSYHDANQNLAADATATHVLVNVPHPVLTTVAAIAQSTTVADAVYHFDYTNCSPCHAVVSHIQSSLNDQVVAHVNLTTKMATLDGVSAGGTYSFNFNVSDSYGNSSNTLTVGPFTVAKSVSGGSDLSPSNPGGSGDGSGNGPSSSIVKTPSTAQIPQPQAPTLAPKFSGYKDLSPTDSDFAAFAYAYEIGAVTGMADGKVHPEAPVQREQIAKIIAKAFGYFEEGHDYCFHRKPFPDVSLRSWSAQYICLAKQKGILKGYQTGAEKGYFLPQNRLLRAEFLAALLRNLTDEQLSPTQKGSFSDVPSTAWYRQYAQFTFANNFFPGQKKLLASKIVSRREVVRILFLMHMKSYL